MKVKRLFISALLALPLSANAALVTSISALDIDGTLYDVTLYDSDVYTFNELWDSDGDQTFGNDSSVFNTTPSFWGDASGAETAANAIVAALESTDWTNLDDSSWDRVGVPTGYFGNGNLSAWGDTNGALTTDSVGNFAKGPSSLGGGIAFASFQVSAVPVPAAIWLFGSGLLGLVGIARRKISA